MVVYADILLTVNLIVDFILLKITLKILKIIPKTARLILASFTGALFSLYIFLPQSPILIELAIQFLMSGVLILICIGFGTFKRFIRGVATLFCVTLIYAGGMIALWQLFKPSGMVINNSVVYFNISPIILIASTVAGYFLYIIFSKLFTVSSKTAKRCNLTLYALGKSVGLTAIIDTGNSLTDILSNSEIIIVDLSVAKALFGEINIEKDPLLATRYRTIPCNTISGGSIMEGFRCDIGEIYLEDKTITLNNPIIAISKTPIKEDYSAILNPKILDLEGKKNETVKKLNI